MNWFAYISLVVLSAFAFANALAFHRAAKAWAGNLSDALGVTPSNPTFPGLVFLPGRIQDALVPPCVAVWFWIGFVSVTGSLIAGWMCLGWFAVVLGIVVAWTAAKMARGIWPLPSSRIYYAAFYECLEWRLAYRQRKGDVEGAHWVANLMAAMEHLQQSPPCKA